MTPSNQKHCYQCNEVGHIKRDCKKKVDSLHAAFALSVLNDYGASRQMWILDSGASRHLIMDPGILVNPEDCDESSEVSKMRTVNTLLRVD